MLECMEPGDGSETTEDGWPSQLCARSGLMRRLSFFMGRPLVRLLVAGLEGVNWLIARISASRSWSSLRRLLDFLASKGCPLRLFPEFSWCRVGTRCMSSTCMREAETGVAFLLRRRMFDLAVASWGGLKARIESRLPGEKLYARGACSAVGFVGLLAGSVCVRAVPRTVSLSIAVLARARMREARRRKGHIGMIAGERASATPVLGIAQERYLLES